MRLINTKCVGKRRRGMSFIEVITSIVAIAIITTMLMAMIGVIRNSMQATLAYTDMKTYAVGILDVLQMDLERGVQIDAENYNDNGDSSGIQADVVITDIGEVHGKPMYRVNIDMYHIKSGSKTGTEAVLREGCIAYAP